MIFLTILTVNNKKIQTIFLTQKNMHIKYHEEIFVNWTAQAQKAVLKVTNPRRSAIEQANM